MSMTLYSRHEQNNVNQAGSDSFGKLGGASGENVEILILQLIVIVGTH